MPYGEGAATSWDFEVKVPELDTSVFILPVIDEFQTRKGQERVVVLDAIAREVVEEQRGKHPEFVFTYRGRPTKSIHNWGWKLARERAGLRHVCVHDRRHTCGHRLRAAGVSYEDRQDLLGHKTDRITTYYSAPDIAKLIEAAESICVRRPNMVLRIAAYTK